jgi:hypothetical protein
MLRALLMMGFLSKWDVGDAWAPTGSPTSAVDVWSLAHIYFLIGFRNRLARQLSDQPADDGIPGGQKLDRAYAIMTSQNLVVGCSTRPGRRGKPRTSIRIEANDALLDVSHRAILR